MARIRTIKPELPQSDDIGRCSREARLLFILLFTIVDDDGRARATSRVLASLLYPFDDDAPSLIDGWMDELEMNNLIRRYIVEETRYLDLPKWLKHQKVDHPSPSRLPPFSREFASPLESSRLYLGSRILSKSDLASPREEPGAPANGSRQEVVGELVSEPKRSRGHLCPEDFRPTAQHYETAASLGMPRQTVDQICANMHNWSRANANRAIARKSDWGLTLHSFIRNHAEQHGYVKQPPRSTDGIT